MKTRKTTSQLKLNDLKVKSFTTSEKQITKGGSPIAKTFYSCGPTEKNCPTVHVPCDYK